MSERIIGFAYLNDNDAFSSALNPMFERLILEQPGLRLMMLSNHLNTEQAQRNMIEFASVPVDLAVVFHADERANANLVTPLLRKNIPVVSLAIPIPLTIFVGVDEQDAGIQVGQALSRAVSEHWQGELEKLLVLTDSRLVNHTHQRLSYAINTLCDGTNFNPANVLFLDTKQERDAIRERTHDILASWSNVHRIVIIGLNDFVALNAAAVVRELGRIDDVLMGSYDGTDAIIEEMRQSDSPIIGSVQFEIEPLARQLVNVCCTILEGGAVARQTLVKGNLMTAEAVR